MESASSNCRACANRQEQANHSLNQTRVVGHEGTNADHQDHSQDKDAEVKKALAVLLAEVEPLRLNLEGPSVLLLALLGFGLLTRKVTPSNFGQNTENNRFGCVGRCDMDIVRGFCRECGHRSLVGHGAGFQKVGA